jgi:hypothetical protein
MKFGVSKHSQIFDGASAYDIRFTRFVLKTEQGSPSWEENAPLPVNAKFNEVSETPTTDRIYGKRLP